MLQPAALHQPSPVTAVDCSQRHTSARLQHRCIRVHNSYPASCSTPPRYATWFVMLQPAALRFSHRPYRQPTAHNANFSMTAVNRSCIRALPKVLVQLLHPTAPCSVVRRATVGAQCQAVVVRCSHRQGDPSFDRISSVHSALQLCK